MHPTAVASRSTQLLELERCGLKVKVNPQRTREVLSMAVPNTSVRRFTYTHRAAALNSKPSRSFCILPSRDELPRVRLVIKQMRARMFRAVQ
jgi:hypothetical protein